MLSFGCIIFHIEKMDYSSKIVGKCLGYVRKQRGDFLMFRTKMQDFKQFQWNLNLKLKLKCLINVLGTTQKK